MIFVGRSVHSEPASPTTACATTAAAAANSPASSPANHGGTACDSAPPSAAANAVMASAEGAVNPSHARNAPSGPPRVSPISIPTWLEVGPGSTEQNATIRA